MSSITGLLLMKNFLFKFNLILSLILIIISSIDRCYGSHYVKYHMSDYCNDNNNNININNRQKIIELQPYTNKTAIMIKLKRESYQPNMNCTINLLIPKYYGLMAFIIKLKLRRLHSNKADYIEFITNDHSLIRFYGINQEMIPKKTILTNDNGNNNDNKNLMTIRFISIPDYYSLPGKGFKIIVNLFAPTNHNNECDEQTGLTMNCQNKICIDSILECDGIDNCRNDIDELQCDETSETKLSVYVFLFTLLIMFVLLIMFFCTKNQDHRNEIVRRMSEVYANNHPILYAMEENQSNDGTDSPINSNSSDNSSIITNLNNNNNNGNNNGNNNDNGNNSFIISNNDLKPMIKSQLSLSLPHGIERLHNNNNGGYI